ncbi:MAG: molybdopterin molybdotransferase MoeA, partial [Anaerolineales bacterium]|nr:molybdopterin molybdotransferase MoeA [Anaerolineales bacterium]
VLAMCGLDQVRVYPLPKVAILSSGDELLSPSQPLEPGKIYESNGIMLAALVARAGAQPHLLGTAPDRPDAIRALLDQAWRSDVDLILTSAGVSVGAFDYLRMVIESHGELDFWRVNMRPGKPLMVGSYRGTRLVGLPGNPVSAFIGFEVFVRPLLGRLSGQADQPDVYHPVRLLEDIRSDGRESYLRAVVERVGDTWVVRLTGHQGSGNLHSLVKANALLRIPAGVLALQAGEIAMARFLHSDPLIGTFIGD